MSIGASRSAYASAPGTKLVVGVAQLSSGPDPSRNLELVGQAVATAAAAGAQLVVCPEATMRCFGRSLSEVAEPVDGPWAQRLAAIAAEAGVVVAAGMFTPAGAGRVRNTLRIVGPVEFEVDAHYDKIHLYDAFGFAESDTVAPGAEPLATSIAGVGVGFATCYDIRFPGLFTALADRGAEVTCVPASWGAGPGKLDQWRLLARARALDSTCFVVAVDQAEPPVAARDSSAPTGIGHSLVVSPRGEVLAELGADPEVRVVELDLGAVHHTRAALPVLVNRRF